MAGEAADRRAVAGSPSDVDWSAAPVWTSRLATLRNVVRQELVARQVAEVVGATTGRALDVGAGQGTQSIRLARRGWEVVAHEPDPAMRAACDRALAAEPPPVRARVRVVAGGLDELASAPAASMDLVLCHGVLMYLPQAEEAVDTLARHAGPGALVSLVTRNARALAFRPARRGDWAAARALLDEADRAAATARDPGYVNELGVSCRADDVDRLATLLADRGLAMVGWYGVRLAVDGAAPEVPVPDDAGDVAMLLDVEEELGRRDPYRGVAPLFHLLARRVA